MQINPENPRFDVENMTEEEFDSHYSVVWWRREFRRQASDEQLSKYNTRVLERRRRRQRERVRKFRRSNPEQAKKLHKIHYLNHLEKNGHSLVDSKRKTEIYRKAREILMVRIGKRVWQECIDQAREELGCARTRRSPKT